MPPTSEACFGGFGRNHKPWIILTLISPRTIHKQQWISVTGWAARQAPKHCLLFRHHAPNAAWRAEEQCRWNLHHPSTRGGGEQLQCMRGAFYQHLWNNILVNNFSYQASWTASVYPHSQQGSVGHAAISLAFFWIFPYGMISTRSSVTILCKNWYLSWMMGSDGDMAIWSSTSVPSDCIFHQDMGSILQNNSCKWIVKEIVFLFISCLLLGAQCYAKLLTCITLFYFAW